MIKFEHVDKVYPNKTKALSDINLTIQDGEFVAIIGKSGAGKSTLIRTINKMHEITAGKLLVDDVNVASIKGKSLRQFRKNIGMIFQSFNLIERTSVINNVLTAFVPTLTPIKRLFGVFSQEQKLRALASLDQVDILDKAFSKTNQLSGGQQQRVALARTLAQNPKVILADEPVASLDPVTSVEVMNYFKQVNEELGMTILINIHDVELALRYCKRVIGIRDGLIVYDGYAEDVDRKVLVNIYGDEYHKVMGKEE